MRQDALPNAPLPASRSGPVEDIARAYLVTAHGDAEAALHAAIADALARSGGGAAHPSVGDATGPGGERILAAIQDDFAHATRTVFYIMAGILAVTYVVAHIWLPKDRVTATPDAGAAPAASADRTPTD